MARRYDITVFNSDANLRDFYVSVKEQPYWETDSRGITVYVGDMEQVLFIKEVNYSGIAIEVEEIDEPSSGYDIGDTSELSRIEVE